MAREWEILEEPLKISEGSSLFDDWKIVRRIGAGSYGTVYELVKEDYGMELREAVKVIRIPQSMEEAKSLRMMGMDEDSVSSYYAEAVEEAAREIGVMVKLRQHENIVGCNDFRVYQYEEDGSWTIVMRMDLLTPLSEEQLKGRLFTEEEVRKIGIHICRALEACAEKNMLHRDIKPANIFTNGYGTYKLGDFGAARLMEAGSTAMSRKGTEQYMAPEVEIDPERYDARGDLYSLGITLYQLANGNRLPFYPKTGMIKPSMMDAAYKRRMMGEAVPEIEGIGEELNRVILKACAYKAEDRYESAKEMREALEGRSVGKSGTAERTEPKEQRQEENLKKQEGPAQNNGMRKQPEAPAGKTSSGKQCEIGFKLLKSGVTAKARELFEDALVEDKNCGAAYLGRAMIRYQLRNPEELLEKYVPELLQDEDFLIAEACAEDVERYEAYRTAQEEMKKEKEAAEEAKRKAAEEAKRKAAEEAKRKAAEEAKRKAAEEAKRKAAEEAKKAAEQGNTTAKKKLLSMYEVGKIVTMGSYGGEAVEWLVLSADGDRRTMIAVKGQDAVCFNKSYKNGNAWESSYIRIWLNNMYYNSAFSAEEQARIVAGPTGDKVWLLSVVEANRYFRNDDARVCYPTSYAKKKGAYTNVYGAGWWWLRSPGSDSDLAASVSSNGNVYPIGNCVYSNDEMARPVVVVSVGLSN